MNTYTQIAGDMDAFNEGGVFYNKVENKYFIFEGRNNAELVDPQEEELPDYTRFHWESPYTFYWDSRGAFPNPLNVSSWAGFTVEDFFNLPKYVQVNYAAGYYGWHNITGSEIEWGQMDKEQYEAWEKENCDHAVKTDPVIDKMEIQEFLLSIATWLGPDFRSKDVPFYAQQTTNTLMKPFFILLEQQMKEVQIRCDLLGLDVDEQFQEIVKLADENICAKWWARRLAGA